MSRMPKKLQLNAERLLKTFCEIGFVKSDVDLEKKKEEFFLSCLSNGLQLT